MPRTRNQESATDIQDKAIQDDGQLPLLSLDAAPTSQALDPIVRLHGASAVAVTRTESGSVLTAASGFAGRYKFTLNPYSGCQFGCEYCYARFFSRTTVEQEDWGNWVRIKSNAVLLLRRARTARSASRRIEAGDAVYMSTVTDPYQPIESKLRLSRAVLEDLVEIQPRLTIQTRSPIVVRDVDLLKQFRHVRVNFTITTDSEAVRLRYEPRCPSIRARLRAAEALVTAGVPIGISISPMLPLANPQQFAERIGQLNAVEYVTQFLKPARGRFSAGSTVDSLQKQRQDGWTPQLYLEARSTIARALTPRPLLEGNEGYAPAD